MVEPGHNMRYASTIGIDATRAKRRNELADSNLLATHDQDFVRYWQVGLREQGIVRQ